MTLLPVIARELRAESRHAVTYWLRVVGAATLLAVAVLFWVNHRFRDQQGDRLFHVLHQTLFWAIWFLVPLLAADCVSRERREGTLGLLFLTPLRARDIVIAKGLAHGLKGMTACLASLPIVVVPFLMGGVDWRIATASVCLNLTSFCWALGAGLLASSRNRTLTSALAWSTLWAFLFFWIMVWLGGVLFVTFVFSPRNPLGQFAPFVTYFAAGLAAVFNFSEMWQWGLLRIRPPGAGGWLSCYGWLLGVSIFVLMGLTLVAALNLRWKWQDHPPSIRRLKLEKALFTPAYGLGLFRRWMRWMLERNPIGWLERRTWSGRLVSWSWLAILVALFSWSLDNLGYGFGLRAVSTVVPWLLILSIALSAAGSFRRERELGLMELLLVTPLRVGQIISGRVRGLWGQFLPAILLLMGLWFFLASGSGMREAWREQSIEGGVTLWLLGSTFLTLPIVGLYFSLRCRHYLVTLFLTVLGGVVLPVSLVFLILVTIRFDLFCFVVLPLVCCPIAVTASALMKSPDYRDLIGRAIGFSICLAGLFVLAEKFRPQEFLVGAAAIGSLNALLLAPLFQIGLALFFGFRLHRALAKRTFVFQA